MTIEEQLAEALRERDEARREAERFRHGCTVEGDFVCPNEYAVSELTAERNFLRALKKNHEEDFTRVCKERDEARERANTLLINCESYFQDSCRMRKERDEARASYEDCLICNRNLFGTINDRTKERDEALARCETLRELADEAAYEQGLAQRRMMDAQCERDEARAEAASSLAMARVAGEKHDQKCAEVDMLRGVGCMEDGDGSCGACRKCAYRRGAEAMREACAQWVDHWVSGHVADKLRDLPIPEEP